MKFATKLTLLFSGLFLILCVFITHIATSSSSEILQRMITDQMQGRAVGRMDKTDRVIFERLMDIKMMASEPLFKSKNPSPKLIEERLKELAANSDNYVSLSYFDMSRKRIVDTAGKDVGKIHAPSEYWLNIEGGKESDIDMYYSESMHSPAFHVVVAVKDETGMRRGVVAGRMTIDWLSEVLKFPVMIQEFDKVLKEKGLLKMDLVDKNGLVIYSNHNQNNVLKENSPYWKYINEDVRSGTRYKGYRLRLPGGEDEIVTFAQEQGYKGFKGNGWVLIIHVPADVVFDAAATLRNRLIIYMTGIGGFSMLAILLFARSISEPIKKLSVAAKQIGEGNLDVGLETDSSDEVAELAKSMNAMARNLSASNQALRRSEESHRELFENANDFVYTTGLNGIFTSVNRSLCERCGYRPEELVGAPIGKIVSSASLEKARKMTEAKVSGEKSNTQYEMDIVAKNGEIIPIELNSRLIIENGKPAGVQGIGRDIGERRAAEKKLRQSEEWFRAIIENQNDMVFVIDENGNFKYLGPSVLRMTGYTPEEVQISKGLDFVHPDDADKVKAVAMKAAQNPGVPFPLELRLRHKNGKLITVASLGTSYLGNPAIRGIIINFHDITERKQSEDRLKALKEAAESATLLKDKFVTLVSHDLKGPLGTMLGFLKLLQKDMEDAKAGEKLLLESAINSGENMVALIKDILNVSRIKSGKIIPKLVFTDAYFLSVKVISALAAQAEQKGITLLNRLPRKTRMYADPELLNQVLQNLVSNAIKFCNSGGTVTIFMPDGEPSTIAVADTGVGISPERIGNLFKYEETTSTTGTAGEAGTGFGLPLSNELVIALGGSLAVESAPGKGSTFSIRLPLVWPRILIVDDDPLTRQLIRKYLNGLDIEFHHAGNGKEALDIMEKAAPHLIITDLNMPVMDGFALIERLKGNAGTKHLPVIIIASESGFESRERALELGADDFIGKDMDINEFILRVTKFLLITHPL